MEYKLKAAKIYNDFSGYIQDYENLEKLLSYREIILDKVYYKALYLRYSKESRIVKYLMELKEALNGDNQADLKELTDKILYEKALLDKEDGGATIAVSDSGLLNYIKTRAEKNGYSYDEFDGGINIIGPGAYSIFKNDNEIDGKAFILKYKSRGFYDPSLVKTDLFHSDGAGGQNVNKVESGVRMTYLPLNITVTCRDERSQLFNKERCSERLKMRVEDYYEKEFRTYIKEEVKKEYGKKI